MGEILGLILCSSEEKKKLFFDELVLLIPQAF
jgi:hypothetical protein